MQQPEIKKTVLRGTVPLQLSRGIAVHAPDTKATMSHMQLTAIKRVDTHLQHRVQLYKQAAQHPPVNKRKHYNLLINCQLFQPTD